jgi:hypothetical protein
MQVKLISIYQKLKHASSILDKETLTLSDLRIVLRDLYSAISTLQTIECDLAGFTKPKSGE